MKALTLTKQKYTSVKERRESYLGGSDAGSIIGVNPWKSAYTLWLEKTKQIEKDDISNNLAVWFGIEEEEIVAKRFSIETGKKVKRSNFEYSCEEYPFLVGHVDRLVVGENAGLECKTTTGWSKTDYEEGDIPPQYYWQCVHYLVLTGLDRWYLAVKKDNNQFYMLTIERNESEIEALLSAECKFWGSVVNMSSPPIDGSKSTLEGLNKQYQDEVDELVDLSYSNSVTQALQEREEINKQIKILDEMKREKENLIKSELGEHIKGFTPGYSLSWKNQIRESVDSKKLKAEYPEAFEKCKKESTSRILRITKRKEEE